MSTLFSCCLHTPSTGFPFFPHYSHTLPPFVEICTIKIFLVFSPGRDRLSCGSLSALVKLLCSLMQSCRTGSILSSGSHGTATASVSLKRISDCLLSAKWSKPTIIWRQRLCCILSCCGLKEEEEEENQVLFAADVVMMWWCDWLTSVGAGLLDSRVCGWASDISDSFSSSSSWMGEDGDLRVLEWGTRQTVSRESILTDWPSQEMEMC